MAEAARKTRFTAGPLTFVVRHELWDGNIQDHADQGVMIAVTADVNGKDTTLRPVLVDPGLHRVTVQGPPGGASRLGEEREFALDVRPCTRYYLVAVRDNRLESDFTVRVDYQEPVGPGFWNRGRKKVAA